jgi:hypothetical protein
MLSDSDRIDQGFSEEFDIIPEVEVCDTSQALHYVGAACFAWDMLGIWL